MKRLTDCPVSPEDLRRRPPYAAEIVERGGAKRAGAVPRRLARVEKQRTGQVLEITSNEPVVAYAFPQRGRGERHHVDFDGARPEGVVIAEIDGRSIVIFIELKATGREGRAEHGLEQVDNGIRHFAPLGRCGEARCHGDDHHDAWTKNDDMPLVPPDRTHEVAGIAVVFRQLARDPPLLTDAGPGIVAGKVVTLTTKHATQLHFNRVTTKSDDEPCANSTRPQNTASPR